MSSTRRYYGWIDTSGTTHGYINNAGAQQICSQPYLYAVAEGDITGHSTFAKFGRCAGVQTTAMDVWEGNSTYVFPASGMRMRCVSTGNVDKAAGAGVSKIKIDYLDIHSNAYTEEVTLNGTGIVFTTATGIYRVNRIYASAVGSSGCAGGNIDVYNYGASTIYAKITTTNTQSRQLIYTVPAGKTLYITSISFSSGVGTTSGSKANYVIFTTRAKVDPGTGAASSIWYPFNDIGIVNGSMYRQLEEPTKIPATADLKISVIGDTAQAVGCVAAIRGWLE